MPNCCNEINKNTKIIDSRYKSGGKTRRYKCQVCGGKFSSFETIVYSAVQGTKPIRKRMEDEVKQEILDRIKLKLFRTIEELQ